VEVKRRVLLTSKNMGMTFIRELVREEVRKAVMEALPAIRSDSMG
jgi:hypothetical protein